jgi:ceramide synthetase
MLHHFVAVSLILFSLMSNQMLAGGMILIVHDMSDILVAGARGYLETIYESKMASGIAYLSLLTVWIFCRILVFPFCLLANVWVNSPLPTDEWYMINFEYKYLLTMAFVLYVMHLYWTFFLMKVGVNSLTKKKMINLHEKDKD